MPRLYFEDRGEGARLILKREKSHHRRHKDKGHHHHLADDVIDHVKDHIPQIHRPWHHHHDDDESVEAQPHYYHHHHHHRRRSGSGAPITWEEWKTLCEREKEFRTKAETLEKDIQDIKAKLDDQKVASAALARDNAVLADTLTKFQDANKQFARENDALREKLASERGHGHGHHRELRCLQREVEKLKEEKEGMLDRIARLKEDLKYGCHNNVEKLLQELGVLKRDVKDAVAEKNDWRDRYERQVKTQNGLKDHIGDMQRCIDRLQDDLDKCRRRHTGHYC